MFSCAEIRDGQIMGYGGDQMRGWHIKIAVAVLGLTLRLIKAKELGGFCVLS